MLYAGDLRHEVVFQTPVTITDGGGGQSTTWVDYLRARVQITPTKATETTVNGNVQDRTSFRITMRFAPGLNAQMRIIYGTRVFNIRGVRNLDERSRWLELFADEGVPQ